LFALLYGRYHPFWPVSALLFIRYLPSWPVSALLFGRHHPRGRFCCTAVVIPVAVFAHLIGPYHPVAVNLGGRAAYFFFIYL
jgi:hypothetical protein